MATVRFQDTVKGTVFDLPHALSLDPNDCNVLLVSSRTLYFIQAFSRQEIAFRARYAASFLEGGRFVLADSPSDLDNIADIVNLYGLEVFDMSCELVAALGGVTSAINAMAAGLAASQCGCDVGQGQDSNDGQEGGPLPDPVGDIQFSAPTGVPDRKCKAANLIHETVEGIFVDLDAYGVDDMSVLGLAFVVGIVSAVIGTSVATPIGGLIAAVAGFAAVFAARLIGITVSLADIVSVLAANEEDLVCALNGATSASSARAAYQLVLDTDGGLSSAEKGLVALLLTNSSLNGLFFDANGLDDFLATYTPPVDCSTCPTPTSWFWTFPTDEQGWVHFSEFSQLGGTQTGVYVSGALRSVCHTSLTPATRSGGIWRSPDLLIDAVAGVTEFEVTFGATSDALPAVQGAVIQYTDLSRDEARVTQATPGVATITATQNNTIEWVGWRHERGDPSPSVERDWTCDLNEALLTL